MKQTKLLSFILILTLFACSEQPPDQQAQQVQQQPVYSQPMQPLPQPVIAAPAQVKPVYRPPTISQRYSQSVTCNYSRSFNRGR